MSTKRTFALRLEIDTAFKTFNLTDQDVDMGTLKLEEGCASGGTFTLGSAQAALFDITLNNRDGRYNEVQFNGGTMRPSVGLLLPSGGYEWVSLGVFNIDEVSRPTATVTLGGSDNLILLDKPISGLSVGYPVTNARLLSAICSYCGVILKTSSFLNSGLSVSAAPDSSKSCRDVVKCIAELAAGFVRCDRLTGALEIVQFQKTGCVREINLDGNTDTADGGNFDWYNTKTFDGGAFSESAPAVSLGPGNRYDFSVDDDPISISGIVYEAQDQDYVVGDRAYALHITDNPLIPEDPTDVLNSIADIMIGLTYLPFSSKWQGNPALLPGDIIQQTDRNGVSYRTIVTDSTYSYRGVCSLSAKGTSEIAHGYQTQQTKKVTQLLRLIHEKQIKIDSLNAAILSATNLITGALGGYAINGDTLADEKYHGNMFISDNPDITKAAKVWRWNIGGFGYSSSGVDGPYTTAITADGSMVVNTLTVAGIVANWIKSGMLVSNDESTFFDLDNNLIGVTLGDYRVCLRGSNGALLVQHKSSSGTWDEIGSFFGYVNDGSPTSQVNAYQYCLGPFATHKLFAEIDSNGNRSVYAEAAQFGSATADTIASTGSVSANTLSGNSADIQSISTNGISSKSYSANGTTGVTGDFIFDDLVLVKGETAHFVNGLFVGTTQNH